MKTEKDRKLNPVMIIALGCLVIAVILTIGTLSLGRVAGNDTKVAVRNVSVLYLSELAGRREQVVSSIIDDYIRDMDVAVGMLEETDLSSTENLQDYQFRMKQLFDLDKFAFVDTNGVIYTSRGTRSDIDLYDLDYLNLSEPEIRIKNLESSDKKVVIAIPVDNLKFGGNTLVVCFMEIDMDVLLRNISIQSNNNTTFCNIYTRDGIALTDMVLGGLASEDNLLEAMEQATYEKGYSYEKFLSDFDGLSSGEVSFSYDGISETLYYVPIHRTNWMLTYLIRESIIEEQISTISNSIIVRSVVQSIVTALVLLVMFALFFMQQRKAAKEALDHEVSETENRVRQQELEEQLAMQEELASKSEELEKALEAAEDANRAKSDFVSNMSHEIRTPITAILGMNEMIRRETDDDDILSYAENISSAGESLLGIISDILDFSKIEAGRMELYMDDYSSEALIRDLYNLMRFRTEAKGLNLTFNIDSAIPKGLRGDVIRVKQIITNLLSNAVKYTEKGDVTLDITREEYDEEEGRVRLLVSVSDTGIGIRSEELDKLFVPFDRLDVHRNRNVEGTGLGLSITRELLQLMHSSLQVESIYEKGSRFYFSIWQDVTDPKEIGDFQPAALQKVVRSNEVGRRYYTAPGKRILVVDDTIMNLQVLTGLLKRTEMIIETASSGMECLKLFADRDYDIVFMDFRMPEMNGIETLHRLREMYPDKVERTPIIALTASAILGDKEKLLKEGFNDYLSKPVNIAEMEDMLTKYVGESAVNGTGSNAAEPDLSDAKADSVEDPTGIPQEILAISELDSKRGLDYCGDVDDYLFALQTYAESVEEKANDLEKCLSEDRIEDYALIAHSLKSMSNSIGAVGLGKRAETLEHAGREGNRAMLQADTGDFVRDYRALGEKLNNTECLGSLE